MVQVPSGRIKNKSRRINSDNPGDKRRRPNAPQYPRIGFSKELESHNHQYFKDSKPSIKQLITPHTRLPGWVKEKKYILNY